MEYKLQLNYYKNSENEKYIFKTMCEDFKLITIPLTF